MSRPSSNNPQKQMTRLPLAIFVLVVLSAVSAFLTHRATELKELAKLQSRPTAPAISIPANQGSQVQPPVSLAPTEIDWRKLLPAKGATLTPNQATAKKEAQYEFGFLTEGMGLSPRETAKLKDILAARSMSQTGASSSPDDPTELERVQRTYDKIIKEEFSPEKADLIIKIIKAPQEAVDVSHQIAPYLSFMGQPITNQQAVRLAVDLHTVFTEPSQASTTLEGALTLRTQNIDPATNLSDSDRKLLSLANSYLNDAQRKAVASLLARTTQRYSTVAKMQ